MLHTTISTLSLHTNHSSINNIFLWEEEIKKPKKEKFLKAHSAKAGHPKELKKKVQRKKPDDIIKNTKPENASYFLSLPCSKAWITRMPKRFY